MSTVSKMIVGASAAALLAGCSSTQTSSNYNDSSYQSGTAQAQTAETYNAFNETLDNATGDAEIVAVAMHADWCGACKTLGPKVSQSLQSFTGEDQIDFRVADFTDRQNPAGEAMLNDIGLGELAEMNNGKTGLVYLVDAQTGDVFGRIQGANSIPEIQTQFSNALMEAGAIANVDPSSI
ncbi:MAG: thioredoxin domain-containing protein [Planctomycetota bacterium]